MNDPAATVLEKGGIRFSAQGLAELDRSRPVVRVPRETIEQIALRWGSRAARPMVQLVLGTSFLLAGAYLLVRILVGWLQIGGRLSGGLIIGLVVVAVMGGGLLLDVVRRGYYLEVRTRQGLEKLRFDRSLSRDEIASFLTDVQRQLGYLIGLDAHRRTSYRESVP